MPARGKWKMLWPVSCLMLKCKRFNGAGLYPKMEEAVQMTRAMNWHTVLPSESLKHDTELWVSWDCCLFFPHAGTEPNFSGGFSLDYLIQTRTKAKHGLVLVQGSSPAEIWYLLTPVTQQGLIPRTQSIVPYCTLLSLLSLPLLCCIIPCSWQM